MNHVLTVKETAEYLRMCPVTIYRMANKGQIPCFKVGDKWRFRVEAINKWINYQENNRNRKKIS
jgi:excisionase family DNA binding protein